MKSIFWFYLAIETSDFGGAGAIDRSKKKGSYYNLKGAFRKEKKQPTHIRTPSADSGPGRDSKLSRVGFQVVNGI